MIRDQLLNILLAARDTVCTCSDSSVLKLLIEAVPLTDCVPFDICDLFYGTVSEHRSQDAAGGARRLW
jgi:hypothetical protein